MDADPEDVVRIQELGKFIHPALFFDDVLHEKIKTNAGKGGYGLVEAFEEKVAVFVVHRVVEGAEAFVGKLI